MKLSIITINYNNASGLNSTIESIVLGKSPNIEYIVIDGASTDGSIAIIKKYIAKINFWVSEQDKGIYNAMNKGIRKATGDYVMFVNSGDLITDMSKVNKLAQLNLKEDLIYFNLEIRNLQNERIFIKKYPIQPDFKYFVEDSLPHIGTLIRRQKLIDYGYYDEGKKIASDWAFFMDGVLLNGYSYKYIDDTFAVFMAGGISSTPEGLNIIAKEKDKHIEGMYNDYYSLYKDWLGKKKDLYKLEYSITVRCAKKLGLLKWLKEK